MKHLKRVPTAKDIMSSKPITLQPGMPVHEAAVRLVKKGVLSAPVVDENEDFVGVFSQQGCMVGLIDAVYAEMPSDEIGSFLEPDPKTITENTGLLAMAEKFVHGTAFVHSLPVLRDRKVVGIVSRFDVIRAVIDYLAAAPDTKAQTLYLSALKEADEAPDVF
jgi:CBS domain-containing protein